MSWLSWTVLQWTWKCRYLFERWISIPLDRYQLSEIAKQYLVSPMDMKCKYKCKRKLTSQTWVLSTSRTYTYLFSYWNVSSCEQDWGQGSGCSGAQGQMSYGVWKGLAPSSHCRIWSAFISPIPSLNGARKHTMEQAWALRWPTKHTGTLTQVKERCSHKGESFFWPDPALFQGLGLGEQSWVGF